jgi:hypothetical protein
LGKQFLDRCKGPPPVNKQSKYLEYNTTCLTTFDALQDSAGERPGHRLATDCCRDKVCDSRGPFSAVLSLAQTQQIHALENASTHAHGKGIMSEARHAFTRQGVPMHGRDAAPPGALWTRQTATLIDLPFPKGFLCCHEVIVRGELPQQARYSVSTTFCLKCMPRGSSPRRNDPPILELFNEEQTAGWQRTEAQPPCHPRSRLPQRITSYLMIHSLR